MLQSLRLTRLASYFNDASSVWDIGCDHGLLGLSFLDHPAVKHIHLVDPSLAVIQELQKKIKDSDIPRVKLHPQKGQEIQLEVSLDKCIFIAGMGGKEIKEILQNLIPQMKKSDRLIISPHRKILELRAYLERSELGLLREESVFEEEQFYQIFCLAKDHALEKVSPYGKEIWTGEVGERYRRHQILHFEHHRDPLSRAYLAYLREL